MIYHKIISLIILFFLFSNTITASKNNSLSSTTLITYNNNLGNNQANIFNELASNIIANNPKFSLQTLTSVLDKNYYNQINESCQLARNKLLLGINSYDTINLAQAKKQLNIAIVRFLKCHSIKNSHHSLAKAYIYLGKTNVLLGKIHSATNNFNNALLINQNIALTNKKTTKAIRKIFNQTKNSFKTRPKAYLSIHSTPPNSSIFINGHFVGTAPILNAQIPYGNYFIKSTHQGYKQSSKNVFLKFNHHHYLQVNLTKTQMFDKFEHLLKKLKLGLSNSKQELISFLQVDTFFWLNIEQNGYSSTISCTHYQKNSNSDTKTFFKTFLTNDPSYKKDFTNWFINQCLF